MVWRTAYRLLNHHEDAWDCYQETFFEAVKLSALEPVANWPALLKAVASRRAIDRLRRRLAEQNRNAGDAFLPLIASGEIDPSRGMQDDELRTWLREALGRLPAPQAQAFWLRNMEGLSYQGIAEQMAIQPSAVGVLLHRAKKRLRQMLGARDIESSPVEPSP